MHHESSQQKITKCKEIFCRVVKLTFTQQLHLQENYYLVIIHDYYDDYEY